jgi:diaminopimelate decarboxylase
VTPRRDLVSELVERSFSVASGELIVGGVRVSEIARQFGTPAFVYDRGLVERQWRLLRNTLPAQFDICYSVKANPNQALLRQFVELGCGLEIASSGELKQALASGCDAKRILFAGPGKTDAELALALDTGIGELHVESIGEGRRLAELAARRGLRARIALRVNPSAAVAGGGMRMGAKAAPFGIDEDQLAGVVNELLALPPLEIVGLHLFVGTQILDHQVLMAQYRAGLEIARRLAAQCRRPLDTIDFGGGWGVPYFSHEQRLDIHALHVGIRELVDDVAADPALREARLLVEPGRFLVAEAGIYLARITDVKVSRGKKFLVTDGGMNHHLAASGNLGQTIKRNFPVGLANRLGAPATELVDVVGPLCTPLDVLARAIELPAAEIGDLVAVFQSGAYARAASPLGFLSRPAPAEVLVADGEPRLVRRRGCDEDYLADQLGL